jgi:hypothetical protein
MSRVAQIIKPFRSMIAALISRHAPHHYKQIIERRHPGVLVLSDPNSDVRILKDQASEVVLQSLDNLGLKLLARVDDRNCWIVLAQAGEEPKLVEQLILKFLECGLRVSVLIEGRRSKMITSKELLDKLRQRGPMQILSIRAGTIWMRARGRRQIGWHAATRVHFYDWDKRKKSYRARKAGNLPPMIDAQPPGQESSVVGLSLADSRLDKIRFPIDVVYTWVDGNDSAWNAKRTRRAEELGQRLHKFSNSQTRYMNRDELRYSLRSLYYYAPWVRRVFLVTDDQRPAWYDDASNMLTIVSHKDLFPDGASLPTFNSHAIESVLHRVPGLAENFIYMNDDVFLSSIVHPEAFYEVSGIARTFLSRAMIPFSSKQRSDIASEWGVMNANELLQESFSATMPYKTKHTPIPLRKSLIADLEARFPEHFARLRQRPFRTTQDLAPTSSLHACFGLAEGKVVRGDISYRYMNLSRPDLAQALLSIAHSSRSMVYCLNDTEISDDEDFDWELQERTVLEFLEMMYPYRAPWEKSDPPPRPGAEQQ